MCIRDRERGLKVQVVYMTNHNDTQSRPHELLNGLWVVGIRHYPVISDFPDLAGSLGQKGEDVETVLKRALILYDEEEVTRFHAVSYTHLDVYKRQGIFCRPIANANEIPLDIIPPPKLTPTAIPSGKLCRVIAIIKSHIFLSLAASGPS